MDVNIDTYKNYLIRINNRNNFLLPEIPHHHPESREYLPFWRKQMKRCIEGFWAPDDASINIDVNDPIYKDSFTNYRFCPGQLYFYVNFGTILHRPKGASPTTPKTQVRPTLRDVDWEIIYDIVEIRGFSGFEGDNEYTCNDLLKDIDSESFDLNNFKQTCYDDKGVFIDELYYNLVRRDREELKTYIEPSVYLRQLHKNILGRPLFWNGAKNYMLLSTRELGKDLEENTFIYSVKRGRIPIKDIKIGEYIYGADGIPTKVLERFDFNNQIQYEMTLADGRKIISGGGHLWKVIDNAGREKVLEMNYIKDTYKAHIRKKSNGNYNFDSRYFIPMNEAIQSKDIDLSIDPYFFGIWLGDGSAHQAGITTIDDEIKDYVYNYCKEFDNHYVSINENSNKTCPTYIIRRNKGVNGNILLNKFKELNLIRNKHIPEIYFEASYEQRLELLKGLMDSDGYVMKGEYCTEYSSSIKTLAYDVLRLGRSLGIRSEISSRYPTYIHKGEKKIGKLNYRIRFKPLINIFKLSRKVDRVDLTIGSRANSLRKKIAIKDIKEIGVRPSVCIAVDNVDKLFLAGEYIPTHNSFLLAVGVILHGLLTDGRLKYIPGEKLPKAEMFVGSGQASKSYDFMLKVEQGMNYLPGTWKPGDLVEEEPSPMLKKMTGSIKPNNTWVHAYEKKVGGSWKKIGSESSIKHTPFTSENPEAAAGGRYIYIVIEEAGLTANTLTIHASNEAAQTQGVTSMGSSLYCGTGGSIEKILESEQLFSEPEAYNILSFSDVFENSGHRIGRFFPAIYKDGEFKDKNGNTNVEPALAHYHKRREKKRKANTKHAYNGELMNYPLIPSDMFLDTGNNRFPIMAMKKRLSELKTSSVLLNLSDKGSFEMLEGKVTFSSSDKILPIRKFPLSMKDKGGIAGCIEIFEHPKYIEGSIPYGRYIAGQDPIDDDDNSDINRSLQSTFMFDTWTRRIVAEYTGRTEYAKTYYEQLRRLVIYYNSRLLYENQKKGVYQYFDYKNSLYLLADTPEFLKETDMQRPGTGNKSKGVYANVALIEWYLDLIQQWMEEQAYDKEVGVMNVDLIRSVALLEEGIKYNGKINTDRISSLGVMLIYAESLKKHVESRKTNVKRLAEDPFIMRHFSKFKQAANYNNSIEIIKNIKRQ